MIVLRILAILFFESDDPVVIVGSILYIIGLWKILEKCGSQGWRALIPCYRTYALAKCANRELEGRVYFVFSIVYSLLQIGLLFLPEAENFTILQSAAVLAISIVGLIYYVRIALGVTALFGRSKKWALLWVFVNGVAAMIWGFSGKFQPLFQVTDLESKIASFFSGKRADVKENGLTVNLTERTVNNFFKKKYLLRDIHLLIPPGSMVLLLGGSGAGKTTLVNAINGYEKAKAEVVLDGKNLYSNYKTMQYDIGFVPQQDLVRGNDTVLNTLLDSASLRLPSEFSAAERRQRVDEVLAIFGLTPVQGSLVQKLSGGQRKRLSIAMEFISNPSLFILDEPDSGLDGVMARELMQQLRSIADQQKIVIVITHTPDRVIDLFDYVIVLAKDSARTGRLAFYGSVAECKKFFDRNTMEEVILCINRPEEGGEGRADEFVMKYAEVQNG